MDSSAFRDEDIFAANRARGRIVLSVEAGERRSRRTQVREEGSLRVRFPGATDDLEAVFVNTAGGMTGGDRFDIDIAVGAEARLVVTSAAAEKIYRSLGPDTEVAVRLDVASGARLNWLPQETILFDRACLKRSIEVDLAEGASLLLAEGIIFGRAAMDEEVREGRVIDRWRVRRGGKLLFADTFRLDGAISYKLGERAVAAGGVAVATLLLVPAGQAEVEAVRALAAEQIQGEVGVSAWNGFALVRLCAHDGAALRHDMMTILTALGGRTLPRLWLN